MNWSDIAAAAATLLFVMDPLGNIPVFNAVLSRFPPRRRAQITARELVIALVILLTFLFAGTAILNFLGLTQPSLAIAGGVLQLAPRDSSGSARTIDNFLKSLAADQGERAIGVVLSGAGSDGARGLQAIKQAGGVTMAQDVESSRYDSMPRSAINTGCVDFVLPPKKIALEIAGLVKEPAQTRRRAAANARRRAGGTPGVGLRVWRSRRGVRRGEPPTGKAGVARKRRNDAGSTVAAGALL